MYTCIYTYICSYIYKKPMYIYIDTPNPQTEGDGTLSRTAWASANCLGTRAGLQHEMTTENSSSPGKRASKDHIKTRILVWYLVCGIYGIW